MKTHRYVFASTLILAALFASSAVQAAPREATLFPDTARIVDVSRVALQPAGGETLKGVITLPGQALPDSLTATLPQGSTLRFEDQTWRQVTRQDDARIADLRKQIQGLKTERNAIFAGIQGLDAQIQFWQAQAKARTKTVEEATALAALLTKSVKKAFQDKLALEPDLQKVDQRIKELQEELSRTTGQKESLWEVTFLLGGSTTAREVTLALAYSLSGCGWTPLYRLEARPGDGTVLFSWAAEVWQSSGIDWKQVETSLATMPPRLAISPPAMPPWIVRPRQPVTRKSSAKSELMAMAAPRMAEKMNSEIPEEDAAEPSETRKSTYSVWSLGKRNIPAGARQRIKVREETWPADFVHLVRPALTTQAFIQAVVKLPEAREIPSGQATYLIDGAVLAKRPFSFAGQEGTFSFGVDPLVTAEAALLSQKAGERGFIADKQTYEWVWRFDVTNGRKDAVRMRLEDPLPQSRDERIKVSFKYDTEPTEKKADSQIWLFGLPPGQKKSLSETVRIEAPKEMDLDLGWRR